MDRAARSSGRGGGARARAGLAALAIGLACGAPSGGGGGDPAAAPPAPPQDLSALFAFAEVGAETRRIDFGTPAAHEHLVGGWGADAWQGSSFARGLAPRSTLRLRVGLPRDLELGLRGWSLGGAGDPAPLVTLEVNGRSVAELELASAPREYQVVLPGEALVVGQNRLDLVYAPPGSPAGGAPPEVAWDALSVRNARYHGEPRAHPQDEPPSLTLPFDAQVDYHLWLAAGSALGFDSIEPWGSAQASEDLQLEVSVLPAGAPGPRVVVLPAAAGQARRAPLELPASGSEPTRLRLRALGGGSAPVAAGLRLVRPVLHGPAAEAAPAIGGGPASGARRPDIVIYLVDTLRRDHLGIYGYPRPTSPELDAFAAESALFSAASSQSSWTRPAVASLFTGQNPQTHGVTGKRSALAATGELLPELLQRAGYRTLAVVANGNIAPAFGFARGFDRHRQLPEGFTREVHQPSERLNEVAFAWLDELAPEQPFLLYLHTADPHAPYTPPAPQRARLAPGVADPEIGATAQLRALAQGAPLTRGAPADLIALYDAEIAHNDASFGALLAGLRTRGRYQNSLIVFLSDHGEAFREHGAWQHGNALFEEELAIPLLIRLPDGRGWGLRVASPAGPIDVLPTLLDALGLEIPARVEGRSLLPALAGAAAAAPAAPAFSHLERDGLELESALRGGRKLVRSLGPDAAGLRLALFDLRLDPGERRNLALFEPVWAGYLGAELRALRERAGAGATAPAAPLDPELRERLEALGYL